MRTVKVDVRVDATKAIAAMRGLDAAFRRIGEAFARGLHGVRDFAWIAKGGTIQTFVVTDDRGATRTVKRYVGGWR